MVLHRFCASATIAALTMALAACGQHVEISDAAEGSVSGPSRNAQRWQTGSTVAVGAKPQELFEGVESRGSGVFTGPRGAQPRARADVSVAGDAVTLNLVAVPISQAAKSVLGDILKVNYTVADKITGTVTIQTSTPISRSGLIEIFEHALRLNGAMLVAGDGLYRIVPLAEGAQAGGPLGTNIARERAGQQIQAVTLVHVPPGEMKRALDPITPPGTVVRADDTRNLLILAGTAKVLADAAEMISLFDVDWMRGMSIALYPVASSDPEAIVREIEPMLGIDRDGPQRGSLRVLPNKRLNAILVLSSRPQLLTRARTLIERLDKVAASTEEQLFVHKVRNRGAIELAGLLQRVLTSRDQASTSAGVAPRFDQTTVATETLPDVASGFSSPTGRIGTGGAGSGTGLSGSGPFGGTGLGASTTVASTGTGAAASAIGAAPAIGTSATGAPPPTPPLPEADTSPRGSGSSQSGSRAPRIVADEINKTLLITATRREYDRIQLILDRIDVMPNQVMLEAMIAEVTLNDDLRFGVKWHFENNKHQATLTDGATSAIASAFPGFSYFFSSNAGRVSAAIDALSTVTKVNIMSAPSLMVLDNRRATLQIGDQVPIVTQQAQAVVAGTVGPIVNSVTLKDTGVILSVTPHVNENGTIQLEVEQEVSSATRTQTSGIDSPTIQQRRVRTNVIVRDGDVVTLGGMIQERDTANKSQVPILGDLPVIGLAFRQKDDKIERTELLIFLRPLIVRNEIDALSVTEEFRQRLNIERPTTTKGRNIYERDARRIIH